MTNTSAIDLNSYTTPGEYTFYAVGTATNFPTGTWTGSGNSSHLTVYKYYSSAMRQIITKRNAPSEIYTRTCSSATSWTSWVKILNDSVATAEIADGAVTTAKLASSAVRLKS